MAVNSRRKARIARERKAILALFSNQELIEETLKNDPIWQRAIELGRDKHLPLGEALKIAEQETKK